jgi:hypothetical protein
MSTRAIAVVAVISVFAPKMPEQCNKMMGKGTPSATAEPPPPPPPPPPPLSATTPPIYMPPDPNPTPAGSSGGVAAHKPSPSEVETQAAKAAMEKKKYKDARTILEKKVKTGTATNEDLTMLHEACEKLKDNKCLQALSKIPGAPDL